MGPGERLKAWLDSQALTPRKFADSIETSRQNVNRWISGDVIPSLRWALVLEERTGIPVSAWGAAADTTTDAAE